MTKTVDLENGPHDVTSVSPRQHRVGVAVDVPRAVVIATTVARHVTKNVRMLERHVGQRHAYRGRSVDRQRRFELTAQIRALTVRFS